MAGFTESRLHLGKLHWGAHTLQVQAALGTGHGRSSFANTGAETVWLSASAHRIHTMGSAAQASPPWKGTSATCKESVPNCGMRLAVLSPEIKSLKGGVLDSRFEVGKILGRGGFATVAEGKDLKKDARRCA